MKQFAEAFSPNRAVSKTTLRVIAAVWAAFFLLWWSLYPPKVVPKPLEILDAFADLWSRSSLIQELFASLSLNFEAILWSSLLSLGLAYLTVLPGARPVVTFISKLRFLGLTGLTFVFGLIVTGHQLKVWMLVFGMTVFFLTSMASVVAAIPKEKFDHARTLRMGEWRVVWEVVVLGTFDQALETLRQNAAIGWMMLTMVEGLVRSEGGIGVVLLNENKHFKLEAVFAVQILILSVGLVQDYLIASCGGCSAPPPTFAWRGGKPCRTNTPSAKRS
jgi:NitT/TauT family transport system permease protein